MGRHWTLDDIAWDRFDPTRVDADMLKAVKTAALVEANSADYVAYLRNIFPNDAQFADVIENWGVEEVQHGIALGRWATLCDPSFNFEDALARFRSGFQLPLDATESVRGSRTGELLARCIVESGTSSFYSAIRDSTDEPLLKEIAHRIAGDEFRHYRLFFDNMRRYAAERVGFMTKMKVAIGRLSEVDDDELSYAYHAANHGPGAPYDRAACARDYGRITGRLYGYGHLARGLNMILKAMGFRPHSRTADVVSRIAWRGLQYRNRKLERQAA
ncbi:ferritin-like domain-containing protein [Zavarzinia sp. CC-PAN008]|uniref:ferritin-like domain-containing protein n=1 Tax=Zavarzinia sp. CC-PAN008 TaxID=3243332 RepID=UPI003F7445F7